METDKLTATIVHETLETAAYEMGSTMRRVALSPIFNEAHDLAVGVFDFRKEGPPRLLAAANGQTVLMAAMLGTVRSAVKHFQHDLHEGDVIIVNDPYHGGAHLADWTLLIPVFWNDMPVAIPAVRAHMGDTGAPHPGGYNVGSTEIWHDGVRIPPLKIHIGGKRRRDVFDWLLANNRLDRWLEGDINAMIAACKVAERRIVQLIGRYGIEVFRESVDWNLGHTLALLKDEIRSWPDGVYSGVSILDHDFQGGSEVRVQARVSISGSDLGIDFSGSDAEVQGFINSPLHNTLSYVFVAISTVVDMSKIPLNHSFYDVADVVAPSGSVVNCNYPRATGYCTAAVGTNVAEAILKAFERAISEKVGTNFHKLPLVLSTGVDPRTEQFYVNLNFHGHSGGAGGSFGVDGWGVYPPDFTAATIPSAEMTEIQFPVRILEHEYCTDSAGAGMWRGLPGIRTLTQYLDHTSHHQILVYGYRNVLPGWAGGQDCAWGNHVILNYGLQDAKEYDEIELDAVMPPGGILCQMKSGGGGWGDPYRREPAKVLLDILDGCVSLENAQRDYGVVVDPVLYRIDEEKTNALRL